MRKLLVVLSVMLMMACGQETKTEEPALQKVDTTQVDTSAVDTSQVMDEM